MKKNPKPLIIITRLNAFSWFLTFLILSGFFFSIGVLVGRDVSPVTFDIQEIGRLPRSYSSEKASTKHEIRSDQTQSINFDIIEDLRDHPSEMIPEESFLTPPEIRKPESKSIPPESLLTNTPIASPEENQTPATPETQRLAHDIPNTSISEDDGRVIAPAMTPENSEAPRIDLSSGIRYIIQIASLRDLKKADAIKEILLEKGYPAFCLNTDIQGMMWHRVRIGPYDDPSAAKNDCLRLKKGGLEALLLVVDK